jgi:serine/threonine-protein kinase
MPDSHKNELRETLDDPNRTQPEVGGRPPSLAVGETLSPNQAETVGGDGLPVQSIAGYLIEGELGRGGMGVVYRPRQPGLNRVVALKMILHAEHGSPEERLRFLREAEALARLMHENIVQVYEVGENEGKPFISLEYVEGGSLEQQLKKTPLPPSRPRLVMPGVKE